MKPKVNRRKEIIKIRSEINETETKKRSMKLKETWFFEKIKEENKKNEIMQFAATWMDLEIIRLSEVSQEEKDKYHMVSLYVESNI